MSANDTVLQARQLIKERKYQAAITLLSKAIEQSAEFGPAHAALIDCFLAIGRIQDANQIFDIFTTQTFRSASTIDGMAFYARRLGRHEQSRELYKKAIEVEPHNHQFWYNLGTSERSLGNLTEAIAACNSSLLNHSGFLPALLMRSEMIAATADFNNIDELYGRLAQAKHQREEIFISYALGKELHDLDRFEEAFSAFERGARARRTTLSYDVAEDEKKLQRIADAYSDPPPLDRGERSPIDRHIFIVGLPRSGTTLTERIIGALPGVRSNGETGNLAHALLQVAPDGPGDVFDRCSRADPRAFADCYDRFAAYGAGAEKIIEKLPLNYLYIGAIAAAFARSPIIWVRRHPIDSCFAMYRTLFGEGYPFSYDMIDLARYYAAFDRLMCHWNRLLPGRITEVFYEDLVSSPKAIGEILADRCELPWLEQAVDLTTNKNPSMTASAAQVRGSIYSTSSGIWKNYRRQLEPLADELQKHGIAIPSQQSTDWPDHTYTA